MEERKYGLFVKTARPYAEALDAVKEALKAEAGAEFRHYDIIGACNPPLAHQALQEELDVGLLLPCNAVVYEEDGGCCVVAALDPEKMMAFTGNDRLGAVATEAKARISRALGKVAS